MGELRKSHASEAVFVAAEETAEEGSNGNLVEKSGKFIEVKAAKDAQA
jgi:hypothetical protein